VTSPLDAARAMFEADLASRSLGIELLELAEGQAVLRMRVTETMINGHAIGHGVLTARACERVTFGRSGICDVTVLLGDEVIAEFRGHSRTLPRP